MNIENISAMNETYKVMVDAITASAAAKSEYDAAALTASKAENIGQFADYSIETVRRIEAADTASIEAEDKFIQSMNAVDEAKAAFNVLLIACLP